MLKSWGLSLECGSRCDQDVLVGSVLLQVEPLLFPEDQEAEEGFGSLGTRDAIAQRFQAEGGAPVALDKPERTNFREIKTRGTFEFLRRMIHLA